MLHTIDDIDSSLDVRYEIMVELELETLFDTDGEKQLPMKSTTIATATMRPACRHCWEVDISERGAGCVWTGAMKSKAGEEGWRNTSTSRLERGGQYDDKR